MKKSILLIFTIGILFSLTACKKKCKDHKYDNNCDAICNLCKEERDAQEHQWNAANCTLPETCNDCGLTKGEALGHNLDYYEGYEASCVEDGIIDYWYCKTCNTKFLDEEGKNIATDEDLYFSTDTHSLTHHELVEATCTEDGKKEYYDCYICETYFADEKATQIIEYEDLTIPKKEHIDENKDFICDQGYGEVLLEKEKLQQIIENTMSSTKVIVKEKNIPGASNISYYFDENLLYITEEKNNEKYYYTIDDVTYLFTKSDEWSKEITTDIIKNNISYLFENKHNVTIASELSVYNCDYGFFEGKTMFGYTNSLGTHVQVILNDDNLLIEGFYICDDHNNIIYMYEFTYGKNEEFLNTFDTILNGFKYSEATNTYNVYYSYGMQNAIDEAEVSGTTDNPAIIKLMNDINVETEVNDLGYAYYGILIETGNIIIDLNGFQLSALNDADCVIKIGSEWGETYNAVVTIEDSSIDKSGKIVSSYIGIYNQGGTLIFNNGIIEVNNTKGNWVAAGIQQYLGSVTMNGGSILVTSVADSWATSGIGEDGIGGTVTINGGYINVNGPLSQALYLRDTAYINGGTIECNMRHIYGNSSQSKIYLGTNEDGIGATFIGGINSWLTLNSLLTEGVGYYDVNGNLIEVSDDVKEILDKSDITIKKIN